MQYYEKAAKWWGDKLRSITSGVIDTNDSTMMVLATIMSINNKKPTIDEIDSFEKYLAEKFKEDVTFHGSSGLLLSFVPDDALKVFFKKSGIDSDGLFWRLRMEVKEDRVTVKSTDKKTPDKAIWVDGKEGEFLLF